MKQFGSWIIFGGLVAAAVLFWWNKDRRQVAPPSPNDPLARLFQPGALRGVSLSATDARPDSTLYTLTNQNSGAKIEVLEHIEAADAETLTQDGLMGIEALYANALSPYPTDLSNQVTTDPVFRPRLFRATNAPVTYTYFLLYANDRFGYGATTKDMVKFKSLVGWLYCPSRQEFFKLKLFAPPETSDRTMEAMFTSLRCK